MKLLHRVAGLLVMAGVLVSCSGRYIEMPSGRKSARAHLGSNVGMHVAAEGPAATIAAAKFAGMKIPEDWNAMPDVKMPGLLSAGDSYFEMTLAENNAQAFAAGITGFVANTFFKGQEAIGLAKEGVEKTGLLEGTKRLGITEREATKRMLIEAEHAVAP